MTSRAKFSLGAPFTLNWASRKYSIAGVCATLIVRYLFDTLAPVEDAREFVRLPWIEAVERLDDELVLLRGRAAVAPGREWLANGFLVNVMRERASEGMIVHGPVVIETDDLANRRYARATSGAERG